MYKLFDTDSDMGGGHTSVTRFANAPSKWSVQMIIVCCTVIFEARQIISNYRIWKTKLNESEDVFEFSLGTSTHK